MLDIFTRGLRFKLADTFGIFSTRVIQHKITEAEQQSILILSSYILSYRVC